MYFTGLYHQARSTMRLKYLLTVVVGFVFVQASFAINEHDAIMMALAKNSDIKIIQADALADSLELKAADAGWHSQ